MIICPVCDGIGFVFSRDGDGHGGEVVCGDCDGRGIVFDRDDPGNERDQKEVENETNI